MNLAYDKDNVDVTVNGNTATVQYKDSKLYYKNLPEGITQKQAKELAEYNSEYVKETTEVAVDTAADVFKKNKGVEKVVAKFPYINRGSIAQTIYKEKTFRSPNSGKTFSKPKVNVTVRHEAKATTTEWLHGLEDKLKKKL